jgi:tRNA (adenine37-N6)-methyltransferase
MFATRSPHRPNPIGLSAVRIVRVLSDARSGPEVHVAGGDFLDGTPVLDLKPYVPYSDAIRGARADWASERPKPIPVRFSPKARRECLALQDRHPDLSKLIRQVIALDPRPAFQTRAKKSGPRPRDEYSALLLDLDVHWIVENGKAVVQEIGKPRSR